MTVKGRVRAIIRSLLLKVINHERQQKGNNEDPPLQRVGEKRPLSQQQGRRVSRTASLYDDDEEQVIPNQGAQLSVEAEADKALTEWENLIHTGGLAKSGSMLPLTRKDLFDRAPADNPLNYWANHGKKYYPMIAKVARAVFAVTGGSGALEGDFSMAGRTLTRERSTLGSAYVEMLSLVHSLYLHQVLTPDVLPVPELMLNDLKQVIPKRLSNPSAELRMLDAPDREPEDTGYEWHGGLSSLAEVASVILGAHEAREQAVEEARAKAAAEGLPPPNHGEAGVGDDEEEEEAS